jgi:hypothetical protein
MANCPIHPNHNTTRTGECVRAGVDCKEKVCPLSAKPKSYRPIRKRPQAQSEALAGAGIKEMENMKLGQIGKAEDLPVVVKGNTVETAKAIMALKKGQYVEVPPEKVGEVKTAGSVRSSISYMIDKELIPAKTFKVRTINKKVYILRIL